MQYVWPGVVPWAQADTTGGNATVTAARKLLSIWALFTLDGRTAPRPSLTAAAVRLPLSAIGSLRLTVSATSSRPTQPNRGHRFPSKLRLHRADRRDSLGLE